MATLVMTIVLSILNYFVLLPLYGMIMNLSDVVENVKIVIVSGVIPFNIKGVVISIVFILLYNRLKTFYHVRNIAELTIKNNKRLSK